jgi:uncharacterized protein YciI
MEFIGTARPKRENWLATITPDEQAVMGQHFAYVNTLFSEGKIVFSGACTDGAMGLIVYKAESAEEAQELYENDPLTKSGLMNTELHPFRIGHANM